MLDLGMAVRVFPTDERPAPFLPYEFWNYHNTLLSATIISRILCALYDNTIKLLANQQNLIV